MFLLAATGAMSALSHSTASVLTEPTVTGAADERSAIADSDAVTSDTLQDTLDTAAAAAVTVDSTLQLPAITTASTAATAGGGGSTCVNEQAEQHSSAVADAADSDSLADDAGSECGDYVADLMHSASAHQLMLLRQAEAAAATATNSPAAGHALRHTSVLSPL
jgi:hypothetical protein